MARPSSKEQILDSAEAVVIEMGASRMTLDAVAERSRVSKGGVLYHFPSKEALLEAMIGRLVARYHAKRVAWQARAGPGGGSALKSEILAQLTSREEDVRVGAALLAAIANEPKLMCTVRGLQAERFERHRMPREQFEDKALLLLAAEGLFFLELLQVSPFGKRQRARLLEAMLGAADVLEADR